MLDLAKADTFDPRWWRKFRFVLEYLDRETSRKIHEYKYQFNLALLDYQLDAERFNLHIEQATTLRNQLVTDMLPWLETEPVDLRQIASSMRQQYIDIFGDPEDPEFQKEIARTCAFLKRGMQNE